MSAVNYLVKDKSYFITKDDRVLLYHASRFTDKLEIEVYDRRVPECVSILSPDKIKSVITEGTSEYNNKLKTFIIAMYTDIAQADKDLHEYIVHMWNHEFDKAMQCIDPEIEEKFYDYLQKLKADKFFDYDTVLYIEEVYYYQCTSFGRFSDEWIKSYYGTILEVVDDTLTL